MNPILQAIIYGCALAIDATTVSITNGLVYHQISKKRMLMSAIFFGFMQALMPLLGYYLFSLTSANASLDKLVTSIDHWIAFALLLFLGGKMIFEGVKDYKDAAHEEKEGTEQKDEDLPIKEMILQGVATSIDAFAVGILFYTNKMEGEGNTLSIWWNVLIIAVITFILSCCGSFFGKKIGTLFRKFAPFVGGLVLIGIGVSILVEHLA